MIQTGLNKAGYEYLVIDGKKTKIQQIGPKPYFSAITAADGWSELDRGQDGKITANKQRFPSGIQHVSDYVHSRGTNLYSACPSYVYACSKRWMFCNACSTADIMCDDKQTLSQAQPSSRLLIASMQGSRSVVGPRGLGGEGAVRLCKRYPHCIAASPRAWLLHRPCALETVVTGFTFTHICDAVRKTAT